MANNKVENSSNSTQVAYLIVGNQIFQLTQTVTNIGRRLSNHLVLDDKRISRLHSQIRVINQHYFIVDLNSTGGTFVNEEQVNQAMLYSGDVISLAGYEIKFVEESSKLIQESEEYTSPSMNDMEDDEEDVTVQIRLRD